MPKSLNLEQLRNRARELLRAVQARDEAALKRVAAALPQRGEKPFQLAHAQAVIARENRFASWPKLKVASERDQLKRERRAHRAAEVRRIAGETLARARARDIEGLVSIFGYGKDFGIEVRALIGKNPDDIATVVRAYIEGLSHPNAKVRFECAHYLDGYGHPDAVEPLLALSYDAVPRIRWMALHALSCDACKVQVPVAPKAYARAIELALHDASVQVRRHAAYMVGQLGGQGAVPVLEQIIATDRDEVVRRNARGMLRQLNKMAS